MENPFERSFVNFMAERLDAADGEFINDPDYKQLRETVYELEQIIMSQLPEGKRRLIPLLSEFIDNEILCVRNHAFMVGFKAAFDILRIADNPRPVIFPSWSIPTETICQETLDRARALINREGKPD